MTTLATATEDPPGLHKVGIIGAGQLGQMLGHAASKIGLECLFLDPSDKPPAASAGQVTQAAFDDVDALAALANACDVITYEFENVPVDALRTIETRCPVLPSPLALECAQDRLAEKQLFESLQIPIPGYRIVDSAADLRQASKVLGLPLVVKTRRLGYDGKGQLILRTTDDAAAIVSQLGGKSLIAEQLVRFDREVSAIAARSANGDIVAYALSQNEHRDGILRVSQAVDDDAHLTASAHDYLEQLMTELRYVGVLALELFVQGKQLLANEFAPRVHNSGHWTIEGARTSQFENHLRAITGMPLADAAVTGFPGMINIIGNMPKKSAFAGIGQVFVHDYGKISRPGRKLGHVTIVGGSAADRDQRLLHLQHVLSA